MKIRTKLILLYLLGALLTSVTTAFAIWSYHNIEKDFQVVMNDSVRKIEALRQIEKNALRIVATTSEYGLVVAEKIEDEHLSALAGHKGSNAKSQPDLDSTREKELISDNVKKYYTFLNYYSGLVKNSNENKKDYLTEIQSNGSKLIEISSTLINLKKEKVSGKKILETKEQFDAVSTAFFAATEKSLQDQTQVLAAKQASVQTTIDQSTQNVLIFSALSFAFALLGGVLFSNSLTNSLNQLSQAAKQIGNGVLDTKIEVKTRDEVADLADDFQKMTWRLRDANNELLQSKVFTENIINSMADMMITVDDDGVIVEVNEALLNQTGYQETEIIGKPVSFLTGQKTFMTDEEYEILKDKRKLAETEKEFVRRNGKTLKCLVSASILKDFKTGAVIVAKDITRRLEDERRLKEYSKKLEQSNRELQDFAYVASHDLQEPLRKVQAFGDRLARKYAENLGAEGNDYIRRMRDAAGRMQTLINDLLTFSRVTSKAQPFRSVSLNEITEAVVSDLEVRIEETKGKVEIGELPEIDADPLQMRQLMQNLIGNALKFHRQDETPLIKIYSPQGNLKNTGSFILNGETLKTQGNGETTCQIAVQDNGIGFDEKYLDRIFTVFQRLHGRTEFEGSGVGLAVCRKIVERHSGNITAESKEGIGSTFIITLPTIQNHQEITQE